MTDQPVPPLPRLILRVAIVVIAALELYCVLGRLPPLLRDARASVRFNLVQSAVRARQRRDRPALRARGGGTGDRRKTSGPGRDPAVHRAGGLCHSGHQLSASPSRSTDFETRHAPHPPHCDRSHRRARDLLVLGWLCSRLGDVDASDRVAAVVQCAVRDPRRHRRAALRARCRRACDRRETTRSCRDPALCRDGRLLCAGRSLRSSAS